MTGDSPPRKVADVPTPDVIWEARLDVRYVCQVIRVSNRTGQLTVRDEMEGRLLLDRTVSLRYGAEYGPDVENVDAWQNLAEIAIATPAASMTEPARDWWQALDETIQWCSTNMACLRSNALRASSRVEDIVDWAAEVSLVQTRRRALLERRPLELLSGRILAYRPADNLCDGAAEITSHGFLDLDNCPPCGTWISYHDGELLAWIPRPFEELVQSGIEVNPEECIYWAERGGASDAGLMH